MTALLLKAARKAIWTAIALAALAPTAAFSEGLIGQASIIDGDTIEIHGTHIRLWGIDAPESAQLCRNDDSDLYRCGAKAASDLDTFIAGRPVTCVPVSFDQYGRTSKSKKSGERTGTAVAACRPNC